MLRAPRKSQRQPMSCTNCTRRKLRCSRIIPCSACIDREETQHCRRELVELPPRKRQRSHADLGEHPEDRSRKWLASIDSRVSQSYGSALAPGLETVMALGSHDKEENAPNAAAPEIAVTGRPILPQLQNETVVTLEFLAHGRQSILNGGNIGRSESPESPLSHHPTVGTLPDGRPPWEATMSTEDVRYLLSYHRDHLAWMHNVLHMPTFERELESSLSHNEWNKNWLALLYAVLCSTVYHADGNQVGNVIAYPSAALVHSLYNQSIENLHDANFMSTHSLPSVQAICVLLQVAHNINQSDYISVLLSAAIRIAQSLGLHRLGLDPPAEAESGCYRSSQQAITREIGKRVWWFLVRQDWLQIPFQNICLINANQFNTPMPLNCFESFHEIIEDGRILEQPDAVFTQTSYSNIMCRISIIIWKHQERMCEVGHPGSGHEGLLRLYEQVVWADTELKKNYRDLPDFVLRQQNSAANDSSRVPAQLYSIHLLSMAHKILTVHRHFQLQSFRDKKFACTQQSCLAICQRCIRDLLSWPLDSTARATLKMWTVITHIVTCCVNLTFASMFRHENLLLYDGAEMQHLARSAREIIRHVEEYSSIATRGGKLLDVLFELDTSILSSESSDFCIENIIQRVSQMDNSFQGDLSVGLIDSAPLLDFFADWSRN